MLIFTVQGHIHLALANTVLSKMDVPDEDNDAMLDTLNNVGYPVLPRKFSHSLPPRHDGCEKTSE